MRRGRRRIRIRKRIRRRRRKMIMFEYIRNINDSGWSLVICSLSM